MLRLFFLALVLAAVVSSLLHLGGGGATALFVVFMGLALFSLATGRIALRCPSCRKRVKIGATACHHCGREVVSR